VFIALAVLAATSLPRHRDGERIPLYLNENGFIAINPPITPARLGSLSTRTAHPAFLADIQKVLDSADLRVDIVNPYLIKTKGQMLNECLDQAALSQLAIASTSCGRYQRHNYRHCGRCIPCQIRRAAFIAWETTDPTDYVFEDLGRQDDDHASFDDIWAVAVALDTVERDDGINRLVGQVSMAT
jgi:Queuosine biosynthesis protein QueC